MNRSGMNKGTEFQLCRICWQYFVTIPLPRERNIIARSKAIWGGVRGRLADKLQVPPKRLLSVAVLEFGRSGENPHIHALFGGLPRDLEVDLMKRLLREITSALRLPTCKCEVYDDRRNGVSYILKELELERGRWLIPSDNLWHAIRRGRPLRR